MLSIDLSNRLCLVTGGAGELGRVICRTLARCGADVVVHYHRSRDKAEALADEIRALGRRAMTASADVGDRDSVFAMRDEVVKTLGAPQILVNNAVVQYAWTTVLDQDVADYESQFRSCVLQNVLMAKAFVPFMIERNYGRIVAINTECAMMNTPTQSAYVAGKRGMDGVLRVLAKEIGSHQITVNQVAPGWMISDRQRGTAEENQPDYAKTVALKRRGYDQDIANTVAFLASDLANFITGAYVPVCGGNVMPAI